MIKKFLETGKIVGTHGIKGMVRVQPWSDSADFLGKFKFIYTDKNGERSIRVISAKPHGNVVLMALEGVDSIEAAEKLRGLVIYIDRDDVELPKDRYFISDLLGCTVKDADTDETLGVLSDVSKTGANDVWHIKQHEKEYLVPVIEDVIVSVDAEKELIFIRPLKGIFDNED
ncbi:MAG: ribosome maturation factor RimM [Acutalibacteraceae bacterium]|jgi:16S rRNA processing protein RimM